MGIYSFHVKIKQALGEKVKNVTILTDKQQTENAPSQKYTYYGSRSDSQKILQKSGGWLRESNISRILYAVLYYAIYRPRNMKNVYDASSSTVVFC